MDLEAVAFIILGVIGLFFVYWIFVGWVFKTFILDTIIGSLKRIEAYLQAINKRQAEMKNQQNQNLEQ